MPKKTYRPEEIIAKSREAGPKRMLARDRWSGSIADVLPTDESQVPLDSSCLPCKLRFWVRATAS